MDDGTGGQRRNVNNDRCCVLGFLRVVDASRSKGDLRLSVLEADQVFELSFQNT